MYQSRNLRPELKLVARGRRRGGGGRARAGFSYGGFMRCGARFGRMARAGAQCYGDDREQKTDNR